LASFQFAFTKTEPLRSFRASLDLHLLLQ